MYTVMLVDDDYPVLEFLEKMIPWQKLGLQVHSTCKNGLVALKEAEHSMPDIVVTDIGMPQMDGIALITELKRLNPNIRVIILSCMDDFSYAQKAVKLKVNDYVLKETMQQNQMIELLERLRDDLQQEAAAKAQNQKWKSMTEENDIVLKQNLLHRIVHHLLGDFSDWAKEAQRFGIEFAGQSYLPLLCYVNRHQEVKERFINDNIIMFGLGNVASEILLKAPGAIMLPYSSKEFILLFPYKRSLREDDLESIQSVSQEIRISLQKYLKISVSFLYGTASSDPQLLSTSIIRLLKSADSRFYLKEGGIYKSLPNETFSKDDLFADFPAASQEIRDAFMEEAEDKLNKIIYRWMGLIQTARFPPQIVKEWTLKILYDNQARLLAMQHYQSTFSMEVLHHTIGGIDSIDELTERVIKFFKERIPLIRQIYQQSRRSEIMQAQQYVAKNLHKKITLEEVSDKLHINSSYFSRLFKKETGDNFIQYVTSSKMERAKELLEQTNKSVEDIADQLGYDNKSYFTKLFKNHTGTTPGEFRGGS